MSQRSEILRWAKQKGLFRAREATDIGFTRATISRLVDEGALERVGYGLYRIAGQDVSEHHTLALVAKRIDEAVICLFSALAFHGLTTQSPSSVWVAIVTTRRAFENSMYPPIEVIYMSPPVLKFGVEEHLIERVPVKITSPAKTVADCFKHRNKIGIEVALEALRDYKRKYRGGMDELWRAATVCRVTKVIYPYLQASHG